MFSRLSRGIDSSDHFPDVFLAAPFIAELLDQGEDQMHAQAADAPPLQVGVRRGRRQRRRVEGGAIILQPDPHGRPKIGEGQRREMGPAIDAAMVDQIRQPLLYDK